MNAENSTRSVFFSEWWNAEGSSENLTISLVLCYYAVFMAY